LSYSIRYLNEKGITERSEFLALESDTAATDYARVDLGRHFIVEVWKGEDLLSRTFRDSPAN
jgi:hypothetical protein